jgi:hypothetical protein
MEPDLSSIDSEIAEVRNKIRLLSQQMSEGRDRLRDLGNQIHYGLKNDPKDIRIDNFIGSVNMEVSLLREQSKRINEQKKLWDKLTELRKKRRSF